MAATKEIIRQWLEDAREEGATHLIVVCDTFDYEDYPVPVKGGEDVDEVAKRFNTNNMQKIMEIYNLSMNLEEQLAEHRAYHV